MQDFQSGEAARRQRAKWALVLGMLLLASAEAFGEEVKTQDNLQAARKDGRSARRIVVSLDDRKLALVEDSVVVKIYPVAIGSPSSPSPAGEFRIVQRVSNPAYYHPGVVIPPGRANPLGTRWLGLSSPSYGIHGTNEPQSIGRNASHGCIRMRNHDVEELFEQMRVGDVVEIREGRDIQTAQLFHTAGTFEVLTAAAE